MDQIRVHISGSVRIYREGLAYSLGRHPAVSIVATTEYENLVEQVLDAQPDIVLLDVSAPESLALIDALRHAAPRTKIVVFAIEDSDDKVLEYAEAGVVAFAPRDWSIEQLIATLESAVRGEVIWTPRRTALLVRRLSELAAATRSHATRIDLTAREHEIADCIATGMSNKQIASELGIEVSTVKNHVHALLEKLHVVRRGEAAAVLRGSSRSSLAASRRLTADRQSLR